MKYVVVVEQNDHRVSHHMNTLHKAIDTMASMLMFHLTTESDRSATVSIEVYSMHDDSTKLIANCEA